MVTLQTRRGGIGCVFLHVCECAFALLRELVMFRTACKLPYSRLRTQEEPFTRALRVLYAGIFGARVRLRLLAEVSFACDVLKTYQPNAS